jgi:hypothetical protein
MGLFLQFTVLAVATWNVVAAINLVSQVNVSMCNWAQLRANVIRDTIYLNGGALWWLPGQSDGTYASPANDGNVGVVYSLNLTMPFDQTTNLTSLFKSMSTPTTNNISANFIDGAMFVNDDEFILYGGLTRQTDSSQGPPAANLVLGYEQDQYGLGQAVNWQPGFLEKDLTDGVTRYITDGGAVSAPSENLGFYFSGVHGQNWGAIEDDDQSANVTANTLITVNMSTMRNETWSNNTLPGNIPGRINAELVWIPVSQSGVLIAIGGVLYSDAMTSGIGLTTTQAAASNQTSPSFMQTVPVYDIANNKWYMQQTSGDIPPQLTLFCSVMAAAADNSSYNIYIYGGYDGIDSSHPTSDDVYVLSIPSFIWVKVYSGTSTHGRSGHKCVKVYPDQMFVLGGIHQGDATICLNAIVQVFNLNTLQFQNSYSPTTWSKYNVPSLVTAQIGGNGQGSATKTPANWTTSLAAVFQSKYPGTITTYYPYSAASNTTSPPSPTIVSSPSNSSGGSKIPTWLGAVIGVILGVAVIGMFLAVWFFCRRRPKRPRAASSSSYSNHTRVFNWINAAKSPTTTVDPSSINDQDVRDRGLSETASVTSAGATAVSDVHESGGGQVHELDSSRPVELPTNYNNGSINQATLTRLHRTSDSPSLDGILSLNNVSPGAGIQNNESRSSHRHQGSGGSVSLPDIAEEQNPHRGSTASALSNISEEMTSRITRLHHNPNLPEIFSPDITASPDSMVSPDIADNPDAAASPNRVSTYIFSPDTVGLPNPNVENPAEEPDSG